MTAETLMDLSNAGSVVENMDIDSFNEKSGDDVGLYSSDDAEDDSAKIGRKPTCGYDHSTHERTAIHICCTRDHRSKSRGTLYSSEYCDNIRSISSFETLPIELLQDIATFVNDDRDFSRLMFASPSFAERLKSNEADVWRRRFLARYDPPLLTCTDDEFAIAYKIRRLVLRKLDGQALRLALKDKAEHQLLVIQDMILETYNQSRANGNSPKASKNLTAMSSPDSSPWIVNFMGCALFGNQKIRYGRPHTLFDTVQVTLSHLVLSQRSPVLLRLPSNRGNYDLTKVYNYNKPFTLIFDKSARKRNPHDVLKSSDSPNLTATSYHSKRRYKVDMHALLHIRNFWQQHFAVDVQVNGENTYASMAYNLFRLGKIPEKWDCALQKQIPLNTKWYGHYSCLHPWPKSRKDLEERQSCAEDWDIVDPMILEFETSTDNDNGLFWPPVFSTLPIFEDAEQAHGQEPPSSMTYIRGIAPFLELRKCEQLRPYDISTKQDNEKRQKWQPYLASRLHGFAHDIPEEAILDRKAKTERFSDPRERIAEKVIPGWKRIVMVVYKPTTRQLLSTLEHAQENYGDAWGTEISFNTAEIWNGESSINDGTASSSNGDHAVNDIASNVMNGAYVNSSTDTTNGSISSSDATSSATSVLPTEAEIEMQLKKLLSKRISSFTQSYSQLLSTQTDTPTTKFPSITSAGLAPKSKTKTELPPLFSAQHIRQLEEDFSSVRFMTWDDGTIEYAYAYEGIVIPGGKIMMGRWWRIHGIDGLGIGKEIGPDGNGVEVRSVIQPSLSDTSLDLGMGEEKYGVEPKDNTRMKTVRRRKNRKRRFAKRSKSRLAYTSYEDNFDNIEDGDDSADAEHDDDDQSNSRESKDLQHEEEGKYEFVTMLNGEESRAVNGIKGLERGPFVFWAG